ncbi:hypothetical protein AB6A40_002953 [Gnathostoma spinigerum]|uniref:Ribosomal RNA-processing protein 42 n=1 Tax=Gnathostoma spinigerum TaxID=75299 RepID=A0ABD6E836_9BILA
MEIHLSDAEKVYIIRGAQEGIRSDGRSPLDYRPLSLETGVLSTTNGSARVRLSSTDLLIGVKADLTEIDDVQSYRNRLKFYIDCSANATPSFEGKGGQDFATEIACALEAAYDNDLLLPDLKRLILSPYHVWRITVDIVILQCGGNILDAAGLGVKAALHDTEIPNVVVRPADEGKFTVDLPDDCTVWKMDVSRAPLFVCVNKIGTANVVDATLYEEATTRVSLWIGVSIPLLDNDMIQSISEDQCQIPLVRQCGGGALEQDSLDEMLRVGIQICLRLHAALSKRLADEENDDVVDRNTFLR